MDLVNLAAEAVQDDGIRWGIVVAVFLAGLRHGFDLDHIAAITDITSSQTSRRRSFTLATVYAVGHASVLTLLGVAAVLLGREIPPSIDSMMGRAIGMTLVALGIYVVYALVRFRRDFRLRSRWMVVIAAIRRTVLWLRRYRAEHVEIEHAHPHSAVGHHHGGPDEMPGPISPPGAVALRTATHTHVHKHVVTMPADPFEDYGTATCLGIGMIHGVGAETPSQVLLFTTAAGLAGSAAGLALVAAFVVGLLLGNSILATAMTMGFSRGERLPRLYMVLAGTTALVSIYVGVAYMLGRTDWLPTFLGG
ncbi:MAG TPA: hypothetical protein VNC78_10075 [Actinomycetota bacterium]|nr:hypothetical protein [Actinomycetota bacterium]